VSYVINPQGFFVTKRLTASPEKIKISGEKGDSDDLQVATFSGKFQPSQPFKDLCNARARVPEYALKVPILCGGKVTWGG